MKKFFMFLYAVTLIFSMVGSARAVSFTNGSFETGDFTGWNVTNSLGGSSNVVIADSGFTATDGSYFANLTANSLIAQEQSWIAGETISFDWNFNANDYLPYNDYSILLITNSSNNVIDNITLANVTSVGNFSATGWNTYEYLFADTGFGAIGFGVYNAKDTGWDSQLYIDNVSGGAHAPEPSTILLMGSGLLGLLGYSRKRFSKKS